VNTSRIPKDLERFAGHALGPAAGEQSIVAAVVAQALERVVELETTHPVDWALEIEGRPVAAVVVENIEAGWDIADNCRLDYFLPERMERTVYGTIDCLDIESALALDPAADVGLSHAVQPGHSRSASYPSFPSHEPPLSIRWFDFDQREELEYRSGSYFLMIAVDAHKEEWQLRHVAVQIVQE